MKQEIKLLSKYTSLLLAIGLLTFLGACGTREASNTNNNTNTTARSSNSRLDLVLQRGKLICGVSGKLPGFSFINERGEYSGLDVDVCRAVAAALFDDPNRVEFRNLSTQERFNALKTGEIDLLARNTTWTISRDTDVGLEFAPVVFYDGQGMMVAKNSGITRLEDLRGRTICVKTGTTALQNLADQVNARNVNYTPIAIGDDDQLYNAYFQNRCQAIISDRSQLVGRLSNFPTPEDHKILDLTLSKEPLAPAVVEGDPQWLDAVRWTVFALIQAEEFGITSENLNTFANSEDPSIKRFLGIEGSIGQNMGLSNDFAARIVKHVGNYGEIYDRNIGKPLNLDRGLNQIWTEGGLLYSPPFSELPTLKVWASSFPEVV